MNIPKLGSLLFATCIVVCSSLQSHAQGLRAATLLPGGTNCFNVIQMIQIHGVNNSFDLTGAGLLSQGSPWGPASYPIAECGDLEIVQVTRIEHADPACGPKFNVAIRNNSVRDVCNFHVSVVATLGRIFPMSPCTTIRVAKILPGETLPVCVVLPIEALAMGNRNGQAIGFQTLVVAIDSFDELIETNEANNLKAFACLDIPVAAVVVEQPTVGVVQGATTAVVGGGAAIAETVTGQPVTPATVVPATVVPSTGPATNAVPAAPSVVTPSGVTPPAVAPSVNADSLQSAIRMMNQPETEATADAVATSL